MTLNIRQAFLQFWMQAPALQLALFYCSGVLFAFELLWGPLLFLLLLLTIPVDQLPRITLFFLLPLMTIHLPHQTTSGEGIFYVQSITHSKSLFKRGYCHRGYWSFSDRLQGRRLPCYLFSKEPLTSLYAKGEVTPDLRLKVIDEIPLKRFELAQLRFNVKRAVSQAIHRRIAQKEAAHFLSAIFVGEIEDQMLFFNFSKVGLTHLLAISGLHFGLVALFCQGALFFLPKKLRLILLIFLLTLYYLFLGTAPSVQRAYFFILIQLLGKLLGERTQPLNTLGAALLIAAICDPFALKTLSLQLTFLATLGILLFYKPKKLNLKDFSNFSLGKKWLLLLGSVLKRNLQLMLAVHVMILPLLLVRFHCFFIHTFFYNLIFPFLMSVSLLLLLLGFVCPLFHQWDAVYTAAYLRIVETPPLLLPGVYFEEVSSWLMGSILISFFVLGVCRKVGQPLFLGHRWFPSQPWRWLRRMLLFQLLFLHQRLISAQRESDL